MSDVGRGRPQKSDPDLDFRFTIFEKKKGKHELYMHVDLACKSENNTRRWTKGPSFLTCCGDRVHRRVKPVLDGNEDKSMANIQ